MNALRRFWCWFRYGHVDGEDVRAVGVDATSLSLAGGATLILTDTVGFAPGMRIRVSGTNCLRCGTSLVRP